MGIKKYLMLVALSSVLVLGACGSNEEEITDPNEGEESSDVEDTDMESEIEDAEFDDSEDSEDTDDDDTED